MRVCRIEPDGKMFYFLNDPLGSPIMIADESGNAVQRYIYDPFGTMMLSKGDNQNHYTYTGKEYDAESGLMYYGARFYDPKVGRFTTRDIAGPDYGNGQSLNRYVYCWNNPIKLLDPNGLDPRPIAYFYDTMRPGDILLVHGYDIPSFAIRTLTNSYWNHSAIYVGNGEVIEMRAKLGKSIAVTPLIDLVGGTGQVGVFRAKVSSSTKNMAVGFAVETTQQDLKYDFTAIATGGLIKNLFGDRYICSEHTYAAFAASGLNLSNRDNLVTPGDIANSPFLQRVDFSNQLLFSSFTNYNYWGWNSIGFGLDF